MSELDTILFANEAFYHAFADGDAAAMEELWASRASVCCIHPGWEAIHERDQVLESWHTILNDPPDICCVAPRAYLFGDAAFVVCFEAIDGDHLIATNYFIREDGRWKMIHHQAGPTRFAPSAAPAQTGGSIH
jgi:hypothetical protein